MVPEVAKAGLDALLARPCLFRTLVAENGREPYEATTAEAEDLARMFDVNVRTIQNRRSEWLRDLRSLLSEEIQLLCCVLVRRYPEMRA